MSIILVIALVIILLLLAWALFGSGGGRTDTSEKKPLPENDEPERVLRRRASDRAIEKEFPEDEAFLKSIGAKEVIPREEVNDETGKPMLKSLWAGAIDTIGGNMLSSVIRQTAYAGAVTTCGNASGMNFEANVFPFILRGVTLFGIDSVECPMEPRIATWLRMAKEWKPDNLEQHASECSLEELDTFINIMLKGYVKERKVINLEL